MDRVIAIRAICSVIDVVVYGVVGCVNSLFRVTAEKAEQSVEPPFVHHWLRRLTGEMR